MNEVLSDRKTQIKEVAQDLFRNKGYAGTSMRDLAKEVGIEPASLYSHISSKAEILEEICFRIADEFLNANREIPSSDLSPEKKLRKAIHNHIDVIVSNLSASAVFLHDWVHLPEPKLTEFKSLRLNYEWIFRNLVKEGVESGDFRPQDEKFTVLMMFSSLNWIYDWYKPDGKYSPGELADQLFEIVFKGIKNH